MTNLNKIRLFGSLSVVVLAVFATVACAVHDNKPKKEQIVVKTEEVKKVINLPIPVERVEADLLNMHFSPERVKLMIEEYKAGHVDIYKFFEQLEGESNA